MFRLVSACLLFVVLNARPARAQSTGSDSTHALPGITIVDRREPFYGNDSAAYAVEITASRLERSGRRTVAEVLSHDAGLFVRQYGPGGLGGVSLRGTGPSHTAVLLDGLPLVNPQVGQVDLSLLPTFMLSAVEVVHGGASSLVGGGAVGGVVSLTSLGVAGGNQARVSTGLGAWGERRISGRLRLGGGRVRGVIAGEMSRSDGDFPYTDRSSFPTARKARENADGAADNLMARFVVAGPASTLEISGWLMRANRGLPGLSGSRSSGERQEDVARRLWLRYLRRGTTLTGSSQQSILRYHDPSLGLEDTGTTFTHSIGASQNRSIGSAMNIDFGVDVSVQSASHPSLERESSQRSVRAFVLGSLAVGRLNVLPSVRGNWIARDAASARQISPGLRLRVRPVAGGAVALWTGVSTSFRAPTFNDLYWRSAGALGNPGLRPERGFSTDLGVDVDIRSLTIQAAAFYQRVSNQITWLFSESGTWRPENVGRVASVGLESAASATFSLANSVELDLTGQYTLTDSRDKTDAASTTFGKPLRYVPLHLLSGDAQLRWRSVTMGAAVRRTSRRYVTSDATEWLPAYTVITGRLSTRLEAGSSVLELGLVVENLGGSEYQIVSGYPMPPRHARIQLTLSSG